MKTATYTAYGSPDVIRFEDRPIPQPAPGEVRIRVMAAPVTAGDVRLRSGKVPRGMGTLLRLVIGWRRPKIGPGWGFAGVVDALGAGVTGLAVGQKVFGHKGFKGGSHAEYLTIRAGGSILPLPDSLTMEEGAAFFFGGLTALYFLSSAARVQKGERVLIMGASGSVGSAAVQIAAHLGAEVTSVCSRANHALVRSLGAVHVHDYHDGPVTGTHDLCLDVMGTLGWAGAVDLLSPTGRLCLVTADLAATLGAALRPRRQGRRVIAGASNETLSAMQQLVRIHQRGGYRPIVGQVMEFDDLPRAHQIADTFHKPGNLVVVIAPGQAPRSD
jgi:NADPH:quinone reductase-like Zn-dependent oxidoreductase